MDNRSEKINFLLQNDRFVDWVFGQDSEESFYWEKWMDESRENKEAVDEARDLLLKINGEEKLKTSELEQSGVDRIWQSVAVEIRKEQRKKREKWSVLYWAAAAIFIGLILWGVMLLRPKVSEQIIVTSGINQSQPGKAEVIRFNGDSGDELVFLPDGSRVTLKKGAKISYRRLLNGEKREVNLQGDAFFDVAPDSLHPFYIYTDKMVIRVLGTSFRVNSSNPSQLVAVKTGKVSVYMKGQDLEKDAPQILLPNQACKISGEYRELVPEPNFDMNEFDQEDQDLYAYHFDDSPLDSVFKKVEQMYAIPVYYDEDTFRNCFLTITLGSEKLEDLMQVVTKTIGAAYTMNDEGIYIDGKGCINK